VIINNRTFSTKSSIFVIVSKRSVFQSFVMISFPFFCSILIVPNYFTMLFPINNSFLCCNLSIVIKYFIYSIFYSLNQKVFSFNSAVFVECSLKASIKLFVYPLQIMVVFVIF